MQHEVVQHPEHLVQGVEIEPLHMLVKGHEVVGGFERVAEVEGAVADILELVDAVEGLPGLSAKVDGRLRKCPHAL